MNPCPNLVISIVYKLSPFFIRKRDLKGQTGRRFVLPR
nr:MAG TPA: hypothetical protein [Caudoviricetes sp.]